MEAQAIWAAPDIEFSAERPAQRTNPARARGNQPLQNVRAVGAFEATALEHESIALFEHCPCRGVGEQHICRGVDQDGSLAQAFEPLRRGAVHEVERPELAVDARGAHDVAHCRFEDASLLTRRRIVPARVDDADQRRHLVVDKQMAPSISRPYRPFSTIR